MFGERDEGGWPDQGPGVVAQTQKRFDADALAPGQPHDRLVAHFEAVAGQRPMQPAGEDSSRPRWRAIAAAAVAMSDPAAPPVTAPAANVSQSSATRSASRLSLCCNCE